MTTSEERIEQLRAENENLRACLLSEIRQRQARLDAKRKLTKVQRACRRLAQRRPDEWATPDDRRRDRASRKAARRVLRQAGGVAR